MLIWRPWPPRSHPFLHTPESTCRPSGFGIRSRGREDPNHECQDGGAQLQEGFATDKQKTLKIE